MTGNLFREPTARSPAGQARTVAGQRQIFYSWLLRNILLPMGDRLFGQGLVRHLKFLETIQWWDRERLQQSRDQAISNLVQTAYDEVPFYRTLFEEHAIKPHDIQCAADLCKLPVVSKDMLRADYPYRTRRKTHQRAYEVSSSGSTGSNFRVLEDAETAGHQRACFMLAVSWAGWSVGERHLQTGMNLGRSLDRRFKDMLMQCHYVSAFDLSDQHLDIMLAVLDKYAIQHVWGYPGSLYQLALRAKAVGWNRPLRSAVTWGDNLFPHYRAAIEDTFHTRVTDTYGCGEGIQVAAQCGLGDSYHVHMLDVVAEFLDDNDAPAPPGTLANLVLTRLHAGPMPLIRYRVGDVGISAGEKLCECGRGLEVLQSVMGRDTDIVTTPSGNRLIVHFFTGILEYFNEIASFQVTQETVEAITLRIVPSAAFSPNRVPAMVAALRERGAADLNINVEIVDNIPATSSGKRRFVISKVHRPGKS